MRFEMIYRTQASFEAVAVITWPPEYQWGRHLQLRTVQLGPGAPPMPAEVIDNSHVTSAG